MSLLNKNKNTFTATPYFPLILSVLFIGTSGPLGRLIQFSPVAIIAFRSLIGFIVLFFIVKWRGLSLRIADKGTRNIALGSSLLLAGHWVAYFYSLQLSTVALAMLSMFTYPLITILLEPFYLKKTFQFVQVPLALIALAGIYILLPTLSLKNENTLGIIIGIGSAFLFAARNLMIKKHTKGINGMVLITYQLAVVTLVTSPFLLFVPFSIQEIAGDWHYLLFLGVVTTAMGHSYYIKSLEQFSVSTVSLISNFTPVVGIVLGIIFLNEKPSAHIILGGSLIIFTAFAEVWLSGKNKQKIIKSD